MIQILPWKTLNAQVDCGSVAITSFNIFNCGPGQSPQLQINVSICSPQSTAGNWTISYPGGTNTVSFYVQNNCPNSFNCGTPGASTINLPQGFDCSTININNIVIKNAANQSPCIFQQAPNCAALPLDFISFEVQSQTNANLLTWVTADEVNVEKMIIQHSTDGKQFTDIGVSFPTNSLNRSSHSYTYNHAYVSKSNYYRIRAVDFDGAETLSKIVFIKNAQKNLAFDIYPNPAHDFLDLTANGFDMDVESRIFDQTGQLKIKSNATRIPLGDLPPGIYFIHCLTNGEDTFGRFLKL